MKRQVPVFRHSALPGWILVIAILVSVVLSAYNTSQQNGNAVRLTRIASCQARYNSEVSKIIAVRARQSQAERNATTTLIRTVFTPPKTLKTEKARMLFFEHAFLTWSAAETRYQDDLRREKFPSLQARCG